MIKYYCILLKIAILIGSLAVLTPNSASALPDFDFSVEVRHESCSSDGELKFSVSPTEPSAVVTYSIFLLPEKDKPFQVQQAETLSNLSAGNYRIIATQELNGESTSKQVDVTIDLNYEPIEFNIIADDMCQEDDGRITVEVTSGNASTYQIQGPENRSPQSDNVFEDLPQGNYNVQVTNECGETLTKNFEILKTGFTLDESKVDFLPLLPNCGEITVGHFIGAVGSGIQYPIHMEFIVDLPGGGEERVESVVESGETYEGFVYGTIPYAHETGYSYDVKITDACGNEAISNNIVVDRKLTVSKDLRWGFGDCGKRRLAISPVNYTPPYTINFISHPETFDPASNENFPGPYEEESTIFYNDNNPIPDGEYVFEVIDACGNSSGEITMGHKEVVFAPSQIVYRGCGPEVGSVQLMNHDYNMTYIEIVSAPAGYSHPLPHDVTENINKSDGRRFSLTNLPEGEYEFYLEEDCGNSHSTKVEIIGHEVLENEVEIIETCGSFNLHLQHRSNLEEDQSEKFGLQKLDPNTGIWGHPKTGEPYTEGEDLNNNNALMLFNNNTNYNLPFSGTFRVVKSFINWKNGSQINEGENAFTYCINPLKEFKMDNSVGFTGINSFICSGDFFDVAITAKGYDPLSYKITAKDGIPFVLENGNDPLFQGLEKGVYNFQIEDGCGNTLNKVLHIEEVNIPKIVPNNLCDGENGELAVLGLDFLEFEWWKEGDPANILSTGSSLPFESFDLSSDAGIYKVRLTHSDPNSCIDETLEFEIPLDNNDARAGTDTTAEFCEGDIINLFDVLEGQFDDYGYWEEVSESRSLVGNFWTTSGLPAGVYEFNYIVPGLCNNEDRSKVIINLSDTPDAPTGEPIQVLCETTFPTVADLAAEGENISWYLEPQGGTALSASELLIDNTIYYAEQITDGCPSNTRLESMVLIEKPIENNEIGQDQLLARNKKPKLLTGAVPTGGSGIFNYQWQYSYDSLNWEDIPGAEQKDYQPNNLKETIYYRRGIEGVCTEYTSNIVKIEVLTVDIAITKTSFNKEIFDGSDFTYEIHVENKGNYDATKVTVSDQLPSNLSYVSSEHSSSYEDIKVYPSSNDRFITWGITTLPKGESVTIQLTVTANREGIIKNTVGVSSKEEDADPSDNIASDQTRVLPFFIPNVIKPDNDGKNEYFIIRTLDKFQKTDLVIFNRWGDHIYEAVDYQNDWAGEGLNAGTYYYVVTMTDKQGKEHVYKGWLQIIKH